MQGAGVGDGVSEVRQGVPQGAGRVRELGDREPGDLRLGVPAEAEGAVGEGRLGGEVRDQSGDVADAVVEVVEVGAAGVHRVVQRQFVGCGVDALGQRMELTDLVVEGGQMDSWNCAASAGPISGVEGLDVWPRVRQERVSPRAAETVLPRSTGDAAARGGAGLRVWMRCSAASRGGRDGRRVRRAT